MYMVLTLLLGNPFVSEKCLMVLPFSIQYKPSALVAIQRRPSLVFTVEVMIDEGSNESMIIHFPLAFLRIYNPVVVPASTLSPVFVAKTVLRFQMVSVIVMSFLRTTYKPE